MTTGSGSILRLLAIFVVAITWGLPSNAQDQASAPNKTILVLDASGSMWGQIDGEAKITIAQRVITDLLGTLPDSQQLGLVAYGHRRKGDCKDIEMLVPAGPDTRAAIAAAVKKISPVGKTPLSEAVIQAAEQLKYEEDAATVILVSDGRETCDMDPCEVGKRLEKTGVGFTAHVIGFDVSDPEDKRQLQCLAENTGGKFLTAANASELSEALEEVSAAPAPEPQPAKVDIRIEAIDARDNSVITQGIVWTMTNTGTNKGVLKDFDIGKVNIAVAPGAYEVTVVRGKDGASATSTLDVAESGEHLYQLTIGSPLPDATVTAPESAAAGSTVAVQWTGPDAKNDYISVASADQPGNKQVNYAYTREGSPSKLVMPPEPGTYEVRYILHDGYTILARQSVEVAPVQASFDAPESASAGSTVAVQWTGPDYKNDYISVAKLDQPGNRQVNYTYTREGNPLKLVMPPEAGTYELRYVQHQDYKVLARQTLTVTEVAASVDAPQSAAAGSTVAVQWTGPDYKNDYISVAKLDQPGNRQVNYTYIREGNPLKLVMPPAAGAYEIRYVQHQDYKVLARRTLTVTEVAASVDAPQSAAAGSTVAVQWTGPDYKNDYISVAKLDQPGNRQVNYTYAREGNPLKLVMPPEAGTYEIRYVQHQNYKILAKRTVTVTEVTANLDAPEAAEAGATVVIQWEGPDYKGDYVAVSKPDQKSNQQVRYTYTREGSPLKLKMPDEPGKYELRYVQNQGHRVLVRQALTVH